MLTEGPEGRIDSAVPIVLPANVLPAVAVL